eukprot:scaffold4796_cov169-Ochromonas_danica.AAC.3
MEGNVAGALFAESNVACSTPSRHSKTFDFLEKKSLGFNLSSATMNTGGAATPAALISAIYFIPYPRVLLPSFRRGLTLIPAKKANRASRKRAREPDKST